MNRSHIRILLGGLLAFACANAGAEGLATTFTPSVVSQYMFRGVRLGGPSFQPSIEMASGNFAFGVWANKPISKKVDGQSDPEVDPYAYYTIGVSETVSLVPGFTLYTYPNADTATGWYKNTFEPSIALNIAISGLKLTPKIYYDMTLEGPTYELTAGFSVPLKDLGTELAFSGVIGGYKWKDVLKDSVPKTTNKGSYFQVGVSAPFSVGKNSKLILGLAYHKGYDNTIQTGTLAPVDNTAAVGRGVATVSYTISF